MSPLKHLALVHLNVGAEGAQILSSLLASNARLETLELREPQPSLSKESLSALMTGVSASESLIRLCLDAIGINDQPMVEALAESLPHVKSVMSLDLVGVNELMGNILCARLAFHLPHNRSIESISFTDCGITAQGLKPIVEILKSMPLLTGLDVRPTPSDVELRNTLQGLKDRFMRRNDRVCDAEKLLLEFVAVPEITPLVLPPELSKLLPRTLCRAIKRLIVGTPLSPQQQ